MRKTPLRKVGPRGRKRQAFNRQLNKLHIDHCELNLPGCTPRSMLTWAHSKKSRFLITSEDWMEACRACIPCHNKIEAMSHEDMRTRVIGAILRREEQC